MGVNSYYCRQILGEERYHRLAPLIEDPVGLYDPEAIPALITMGEEVDIEPTVAWIEKYYLDGDGEPNGREAPDSIGIEIGPSEFISNN